MDNKQIFLPAASYFSGGLTVICEFQWEEKSALCGERN